MAVKLALTVSGRTRVLVLGETLSRLGTLPLAAEDLPALYLVPTLGGDGAGCGRLADLIDAVLVRGREFAALVAEPMAWSTGAVPPAMFWERVRDSCNRAGTVPVFNETPIIDEVAAGL